MFYKRTIKGYIGLLEKWGLKGYSLAAGGSYDKFIQIVFLKKRIIRNRISMRVKDSRKLKFGIFQARANRLFYTNAYRVVGYIT